MSAATFLAGMVAGGLVTLVMLVAWTLLDSVARADHLDGDERHLRSLGPVPNSSIPHDEIDAHSGGEVRS